MHQEDDINPFIDEMKDLKLRFKNAVINSNTYTSYADKLDLVCTHGIGNANGRFAGPNNLIPKTLNKYSVLKSNETYYDFGYEKYQNIQLAHFAEMLVDNLVDEDEFDNEDKESKEALEFISQELFEYYLKTDIIAFNYDW